MALLPNSPRSWNMLGAKASPRLHDAAPQAVACATISAARRAEGRFEAASANPPHIRAAFANSGAIPVAALSEALKTSVRSEAPSDPARPLALRRSERRASGPQAAVEWSCRAQRPSRPLARLVLRPARENCGMGAASVCAGLHRLGRAGRGGQSQARLKRRPRIGDPGPRPSPERI